MAAATFAHATGAGLPRDCRGGSPGVRPVRFVPPPLPARSDSPRAHRPGRRSEHVYRLPQMHRPLPRRRAHDGPRVTYDTDVLVIGAGPVAAGAAGEVIPFSTPPHLVFVGRRAPVRK